MNEMENPNYMLFGSSRENLYSFITCRNNNVTIKDRLIAYKYGILIEKMRKISMAKEFDGRLYLYLSPERYIASILSEKLRNSNDEEEIKDIIGKITSECGIVQEKFEQIKNGTWNLDSDEVYRERLKDYRSEEDIEKEIKNREKFKTPIDKLKVISKEFQEKLELMMKEEAKKGFYFFYLDSDGKRHIIK